MMVNTLVLWGLLELLDMAIMFFIGFGWGWSISGK
jgi:hypothetical protein